MHFVQAMSRCSLRTFIQPESGVLNIEGRCRLAESIQGAGRAFRVSVPSASSSTGQRRGLGSICISYVAVTRPFRSPQTHSNAKHEDDWSI